MRAVVQRVSRARVTVGGKLVGAIDQGLLVLVGVGQDDDEHDVSYLANKVCGLRVFADEQGLMNRSLIDIAGGLLAVSQFTLYGDCRKGRRPSFVKAMEPERAARLFEAFVDEVRQLGVSRVATGRFRAMMDVELINDGPVTLLIDSKKQF
ncbi:MAG: D-tyrosyl-tRNA(Tyr) deacylase [Deltaproteobacteria bacterium]|nr:D-tyrosyl-tRNA(Tyr) deacylase [Deltaproteobacteria bacterium]